MEICEESNNGNRGCKLRVLNLLDSRRLTSLHYSSGGSRGGAKGSDDGEDAVARKLLYRKLPQQHVLNLSVLKLDGSFFDVNVGRNATVAELKIAIEERFAALPEETLSSISWSHVWGHFCLCYEGQMLVNNKACIKNLGIKDGDQLQFIRHMSFNQSPVKRRLKHHSVSWKCMSPGSSHEREKQKNGVDYNNDMDGKQEVNSISHNYEEEEETHLPEVKVAHFLRGWLSYTRLWNFARKNSEGRRHSSGFNSQRGG